MIRRWLHVDPRRVCPTPIQVEQIDPAAMALLKNLDTRQIAREANAGCRAAVAVLWREQTRGDVS